VARHRRAIQRDIAAESLRYEADQRAHDGCEASRVQALSAARGQYHQQVLAAEDEHAAQNTARTCVVTVRTTRDTFVRLNLRQVEPLACLRTLNAGVSRSPAELAPVRPVLEFSMVDPRFVEESDVLSTLDQRPNLMELSPGDFESLITNLFEKMGLETRLTQASRDGGVDCVAFDPRPIFGGKVVIQAKRYQHAVGVSAVRDLFGTLQNEGASKGILVTTSGYGRAEAGRSAWSQPRDPRVGHEFRAKRLARTNPGRRVQVWSSQ
jgi:HJR/Mrr/RecB family endonuclease